MRDLQKYLDLLRQSLVPDDVDIVDLAEEALFRAVKAEALQQELAERLEDALLIIEHKDRQNNSSQVDWEMTRLHWCKETLAKHKEGLTC